jgi:alanyl-tRNA synthetase
MTDRLYYRDSYQLTFDATVLTCDAQGEAYAIVLDRTAFYPTSGGQPFDVGTLGQARVREVIDTDSGDIVHLVDRPLPVDDRVEGRVDWRRRFDHMQQHTGQHVLSAAFDHLCQARTESFHLGATSATIDLGREVSVDQMRATEDEANRIVWEDRSVTVRMASADEAKALPLRKESLRSGPLRLIEVHDFDLSACGGTHVTRTGAIGIIAIAGWEKFRGGTRVEFLCGGRALTRFRDWRDALAATTRHLSVQAPELASAVEKLQNDAKALQKTIRAQQEQLAQHEARALITRATPVGERRVLVESPDGFDAVGLKTLASAATTANPSLAVALFTRTQPAQAVIAAGTASGVDAAAMLKALLAQFGGKGGGKKELAQGGGLAAPLAELLARAHEALSN